MAMVYVFSGKCYSISMVSFLLRVSSHYLDGSNIKPDTCNSKFCIHRLKYLKLFFICSQVPRELSADIANFWRDMENPHRPMSDCEEQENLHNSNLLSAKKKYGSMQAINNTVWSFSERKSSSDSDSTNDTQVALAELYAHVQSMPNSSKKKKLMKQVRLAKN